MQNMMRIVVVALVWIVAAIVLTGFYSLGASPVVLAPIASLAFFLGLLMLLWRRFGKNQIADKDDTSADVGGQPRTRAIHYTKCVAVILGFVGTYMLATSLAMNNITGLRGSAVDSNPLVRANQDHADITVVCMIGGLVVIATVASIRWRWMRAIVAGMWIAVLAAGMVVTSR
jgi:hypothetical protein